MPVASRVGAIVGAWVLIALPGRAAAQALPIVLPPATPALTFRTEIIVTAGRGTDDRDRVPAATSVLTGAQLAQRPGTTLADAIEMLPGFQVVSRDGAGLPPAAIARGFFGGGEAEYVKVLIDGVPVGDPESGIVDWRQTPVFAISRIEAARGPASAVYGDAALGGVIQLFTVTHSKSLFRMTASGGSFGSASAGAEFSQQLGGLNVQSLGSFGRSDGSRAHSGNREGFGSLSLRGAGGSSQWTARGVSNYQTRDEPGALTAEEAAISRRASNPVFRFDRDASVRSYGAFRYALSTGPLATSILAHASRRDGDRVRTLLLAPELADRARREISTIGTGASFENSLDTRFFGLPGQLRFGLDLGHHRIRTGYRAVSQDGITEQPVGHLDGRRWQMAGYAAQTLNAGRRVVLHVAMRGDGLEDRTGAGSWANHRAWSPRAGAVISLDAGVTLFAQASRAFKSPTLDQLFDPRPFPDGAGGTLLLSSARLRPQRGFNAETGVRQSTGLFRWEAVWYRMNMRDEIDFDPATFSYGNIGSSVHQGLELDAVFLQGRRASVGANYAWTRVAGEAIGDGPRQLKNIPRHVVRPELTVILPGQTSLHVRYTRTSGAYADDENRVALRGRSTADIRIAKRLSRLSVRLDLLNLTNERYEEVGYVLSDFRGGTLPLFYPGAGFTARGSFELLF